MWETPHISWVNWRKNKQDLFAFVLPSLAGWYGWLCFTNNETCSGWSYPPDLNPQGGSGGGSAQLKLIFSSPGAGSGAKGKWMGRVAPVALSLVPTDWLWPSSENPGAVAWDTVREILWQPIPKQIPRAPSHTPSHSSFLKQILKYSSITINISKSQ